MIVQKYMDVNPPVVNIRGTFGDVVDQFCNKSILSVVVVNDDNGIEGIITKNLVIRLLNAKVDRNEPVSHVMKKNVYCIPPDTPIKKLIEWRMSSLPVVENNRLVGIVALNNTINAYNSTMNNLQGELEATIDSVYNAIIAVNEDGIVRQMNKAAVRMFGTKVNTDSNVDISSVLGLNPFRHVLETGEFIVNKEIYYGDEKLLFTCSPIKDKNNDMIGAVGVFTEYTEMNKLYTELFSKRKEMDAINAVFDSSFDGILVTDSDGRITSANKAFSEIVNISFDELEGKKVSAFQDEELSSVFDDMIRSRKSGIANCNLSTGTNVLISYGPVKDKNGDYQGMVANVKNMTYVEELEKKLLALDRIYKEQRAKEEICSKFIFNAPSSKSLIDMVMKVADADSTVLITGESGTGKEVIANLIFENSRRNDQIFSKINCAAIPDNLLESELFGYEPGAFTGADKKGKVGIFESANHGVILLDEIGEMPLEMQAKLLRVLQNGEFFRIGGTKPVKVDVRILSATNIDLKKRISEGSFRSDLFYRLNVVPIEVPPLRKRKEDIVELANINLKRFNEKHRKNKTLSISATEKLQNYNWPGNIRELENVLERAVIFSEGDVIDYQDIGVDITRTILDGGYGLISEGKKFKDVVNEFEKSILIDALSRYKTTRAVGEKLGIDQSTVVKKMKKYGIKTN